MKDVISQVNDLIQIAKDYDALVKSLGDIKEIKAKAIRFYSKSLKVSDVARLHDVSEQRVRKYIALGLIPLHPNSTDDRFLIRASDAITLDFHELKHSKYSK